MTVIEGGSSESGDFGESQSTYEETPYADASWEVVGQISDTEEFIPMEVSTVGGAEIHKDPMFADYGGLDQEGAPRRWHLPENLAQQALSDLEKENEVVVPRTSFTDQELAALKEQIRAEAHKAAIIEAAEANAQKFEDIEKRLRGVFSDLQAQIANNQSLIESSAVEFALEVSRRLIDSAVEINPEYIVELVRKAIAQSGSAKIQSVRVSPQDMEFIDVVGVRKQIKEHDGTWDFVADAGVKSGCVVETSAGAIDFQLDQAWERIKDSVVKVIR